MGTTTLPCGKNINPNDNNRDRMDVRTQWSIDFGRGKFWGSGAKTASDRFEFKIWFDRARVLPGYGRVNRTLFLAACCHSPILNRFMTLTRWPRREGTQELLRLEETGAKLDIKKIKHSQLPFKSKFRSEINLVWPEPKLSKLRAPRTQSRYTY